MSHKNNKNDDLVTSAIGAVLGLGLTAICFATTAIMLAIFFLLKRPISRTLHLERCSRSWSSMKWLYVPMKWLAGIMFLFVLLVTAKKTLCHPHAC